MRYFRCKCGAEESWSSMGPTPCRWCSKCQTSLATQSPDRPKHQMREFVSTIMTDDGKIEGKLTRCMDCLKTKKELEDALEPMEDWIAPYNRSVTQEKH
jgi:hypothetical protein